MLYSGSARALHVNGWGSRLSIATTGNTYGRDAGENAISMAATYYGSAHLAWFRSLALPIPWRPSAPTAPSKTSTSRMVRRSRRATSSPQSQRGTTLLKPDVTAADGVFTKTPDPAVLRNLGSVPARGQHRGPRGSSTAGLYTCSGEKGAYRQLR